MVWVFSRENFQPHHHMLSTLFYTNGHGYANIFFGKEKLFLSMNELVFYSKIASCYTCTCTCVVYPYLITPRDSVVFFIERCFIYSINMTHWNCTTINKGRVGLHETRFSGHGREQSVLHMLHSLYMRLYMIFTMYMKHICTSHCMYRHSFMNCLSICS